MSLADVLDKPDIADEWWRLNNLYWIKDKQGNRVRFKPNWAQTLFYRTMWYLNIILKARQLGMTTFIQIFMLDRCLFNDDQNAGIVAHNKEDAEAFFSDKIKFAYDNLPDDLRAQRKATSDSSKHMRFSNGSQIRVGTSLRSGTYQYVHVSEFGKMCAKYPDKADEVITGTLNTVAAGQFVFIESTAEGRIGHFYQMCLIAEQLTKLVAEGVKRFTQLDYKFFFFPWWKHPDYVLDDPVEIPEELGKYFQELEAKREIKLTREQKWWYTKKKAEQKSKMKQEYPSTSEEAFERENDVAILGKQLARARRQNRITRLPIERGIPVNTFWDLGRNDVTAIWFHQYVDVRHHFIYYLENRLKDLTFYYDQLVQLKEQNEWVYGSHYLPHDVNVTDLSAVGQRTRKEILEDAGLNGIVVVPRIRNLADGIEMMRRDFDAWYFDEEGCEVGLRALDEYEWKWDDLNKVTLKNPKDTWARNGADAIRQCAQGFRPPSNSFKNQAARVDGSGGRKYARGTRRNNVLNPTLNHVV